MHLFKHFSWIECVFQSRGFCCCRGVVGSSAIDELLSHLDSPSRGFYTSSNSCDYVVIEFLHKAILKSACNRSQGRYHVTIAIAASTMHLLKSFLHLLI